MRKLAFLVATLAGFAVTPVHAAVVGCTAGGDYTCHRGTANGCARAIIKLKKADQQATADVKSLAIPLLGGGTAGQRPMSVSVGFFAEFDADETDVITEDLGNGQVRVTVFPANGDEVLMRREMSEDAVNLRDGARNLSVPLMKINATEPKVRLNLDDLSEVLLN